MTALPYLRRFGGYVSALFIALLAISSPADEPPVTAARGVKHQVTGLFSRDRVDDLRQLFAKLPQFKLIEIDFDKAEITVGYDAEKEFAGATSEQVIERFDNLVRQASNHTFGIKPLCTLPNERLSFIEIGIVGLDCKACCLGAYEAIYRLPGVERATASFKERRVTATIDPEKTSRTELETALKQRGVQLRSAEQEKKS